MNRLERTKMQNLEISAFDKHILTDEELALVTGGCGYCCAPPPPCYVPCTPCAPPPPPPCYVPCTPCAPAPVLGANLGLGISLGAGLGVGLI
jgi:hypothetical protein